MPRHMTSQGIEKMLRRQRPILSIDHIAHVGAAEVLALASAVATGRITETVMTDTLDLFVRTEDEVSNTCFGITVDDLKGLGMTHADRLPLYKAHIDKWMIIGVMNGVMDLMDFALLHGRDRKGAFWRRHFVDPFPIAGAGAGLRGNERASIGAVVRGARITEAHRSQTGYFHCESKPVNEALCEELENRNLYLPLNHYLIRLVAADLQGKAHSVLGPFAGPGALHDLVWELFNVVPTEEWLALAERRADRARGLGRWTK